MMVLNSGTYTGEILQKFQFDDCIITNTLYSEKANNPDWHYHENIHLSFVYAGGRAETKNNIQYTKPNGSVFFYRAEEKHRWISPQPLSKSANIEIGTKFLETFNLSEQSVSDGIKNNPHTKSLILKIQSEIQNNKIIDSLSIQSLVLNLVSKNDIQSYQTVPNWVVCTKELLQDNWNENLTLLKIATIANVHPVTISKNFRKYFSLTLGDYRRKLKVERSIDLIKNTDLSLSEIAHYCNFSDQSHFIRIFKQSTGFLPNEFRQF